MSAESPLKNTLEDLDNLFDIEVTEAELISSSLPSTRPVEAAPVVVEEAKTDEEKEAEDLELARASLRGALTKANESLDDLLYLAKNSEHPRAYEVASTLINTISSTAKQLTEHHKKPKETAGPSQQGPAQVTNNAVFVGSTDELLELLKKNGAGILPGA